MPRPHSSSRVRVCCQHMLGVAFRADLCGVLMGKTRGSVTSIMRTEQEKSFVKHPHKKIRCSTYTCTRADACMHAAHVPSSCSIRPPPPRNDKAVFTVSTVFRPDRRRPAQCAPSEPAAGGQIPHNTSNDMWNKLRRNMPPQSVHHIAVTARTVKM